MGAGLLAGDRAVDVSRCFAPDDDQGDTEDQLRRCGGSAGTAELKTQIAMGAVVDFIAGAVEVRRIHRHGKQQRRYRKEGNELACA